MINFYRLKPRIAWALTGGVIGAFVGLFVVGNFGVAGRGEAFGVWGWLLLGALGAYLGFRLGEWLLKRRPTED